MTQEAQLVSGRAGDPGLGAAPTSVHEGGMGAQRVDPPQGDGSWKMHMGGGICRGPGPDDGAERGRAGRDTG